MKPLHVFLRFNRAMSPDLTEREWDVKVLAPSREHASAIAGSMLERMAGCEVEILSVRVVG